MNPSAIALMILVACANALLDGKSRDDFQTLDLVTFIDDGISKIKDMDPYINEGDSYYVSLNYPWLGELVIIGYFHNFELIGLSDVIYNISYEDDMFVMKIRFPRLESTIGISAWEVLYKGSLYEIQYDGWIAVNDIVIIVRVKPGYTEPSDEEYKLEVGLGSIESKMNMFLGGNDISKNFNDFMETSLQYMLRSYQKEPNNILSKLVFKLPEILKKVE